MWECVYAFTVMLFCADSVRWRRMPRAWPLMSVMMRPLCPMYQSPGVSLVSWSSNLGVDYCKSCQQGFCHSRIHLTALDIFIFSLWVLTRWHLVWTSYCATDSKGWKPCYDLLEPVVGYPRPLLRVYVFFVFFNLLLSFFFTSFFH